MKKMVGALVLGAVIAFPAVLPDYLPDNVTSVACAKSKRVTIYTQKKIDNHGYPEYDHYELEPDSFGEMEIKGIHYISFWTAYIGEYFNNLFYDKANWGAYHFLVKFYPDGSYRARRYRYTNPDAKHRERLNVAKNWEIGLEQSTKKYGKDYFDPANWGTDDVNRAVTDYIKANYPSLVQQNIAYYNQEKEILTQREAAKKQAAEQVTKQRYLAIQDKMEASAASLRNEGFIKVVVDEIAYEAFNYDNPWEAYKNVVEYMDWYIDPANIHYSVGTGKWAGWERYDVLVASVTESGSVEKEWFVYLHKDGVWSNTSLATNDSPLGRSFDDVGSYAITNFRFEPRQEAHSRAGVKYGHISAVMQSVLNYRNGADMAIIHSNSTRMVEYLSPAEFNALPFPLERGNFE